MTHITCIIISIMFYKRLLIKLIEHTLKFHDYDGNDYKCDMCNVKTFE